MISPLLALGSRSVEGLLLAGLLLIACACLASDDDADAGTGTAAIRKQGNNLTGESSVYLRQHAHNPVDWYPWGEEALARARDEDRPIFLSIGYSSCHWCHVMEAEVFEDDETAAFLNAHFICIKVDREERPDLDAVYMEAVQMMTGRGGWPLSAFLLPDLTPFFGGTYFPRAQFRQLIGRIDQAYREQRGELREQAEAIGRQLNREQSDGGSALSEEMIDKAARAAARNYDEEYGGFGRQQKFPTPVKWRFLLHRYRKTGDRELAKMLLRSCEAMAGGGIYDHIGGGFHRYTVDRDWTVPHFEKMLYDNAQLASLFLEVGAVFERPDFIALAEDLLHFLLRDMRDSGGGFYSSFDADSGGEEGSFYVWSPGEIVALLGQEDGKALADYLGVDAKGNFDGSGKSVLTRWADPADLTAASESAEADLAALFEKRREVLRLKRAERTPPGLDRKVISSWNGLAISAFAQGFALTGKAEYLAGARGAADFLLGAHLREDGRLWRSSTDGRLAGLGVLDDYAFLAEGLLDLHQYGATAGDSGHYLAAAASLLEVIRAEFVHPSGAFYLTDQDSETPLGRRFEIYDAVIPSGNAVALSALLRYSALTGRRDYRDEVAGALAGNSGLLQRMGFESAGCFDVALRLRGPFHDLILAGDEGDAGLAELRRAALRDLPPWLVLSSVPAAGASAELLALAPSLAGKRALGGRATAYLCEYGACQSPTSEPEALRAAIKAGWLH